METSDRRSTGSCESEHHACGHSREHVGNETQWTENLSIERRFVELSRPLDRATVPLDEPSMTASVLVFGKQTTSGIVERV